MCDYIECNHALNDANGIAQRSEEYVEAMEKDELDTWDLFAEDELQSLQDLIMSLSPRRLNSPKISHTIKPPQQRWVNVPPPKPYIHTITPPQQVRVNNIFENDLAYSNFNDEVSPPSSDSEAQLPERKRKRRCRSSKYTREPLIGLVKEGIDRVRIKGHKLAEVAKELKELNCDISARTLRRYVILSQDMTQPDSGFYFPLLAGERPLKTGRVNRKRRRSSTGEGLADATLLQI